MWSLTSQRTSRISGPRNFRSLVKEDFFNTIGTWRTRRCVPPMFAFERKADKRIYKYTPQDSVAAAGRRSEFRESATHLQIAAVPAARKAHSPQPGMRGCPARRCGRAPERECGHRTARWRDDAR